MVRDWFTGRSSGITKQLSATDLVVSGDLPIETGSQCRLRGRRSAQVPESEYNPTGDNRVDGAQPSPFHFLGVSLYNYLETTNWAVFAEAAIPLTPTLDVEIGIRHEDYDLDAVTKPKFAGRWDVTDTLAIWASYEQVFRVPVLPSNPTISLSSMHL